jgi:hypothetical protein
MKCKIILLSLFCFITLHLVMTKLLILQFNNRDDFIKVKLSKDIELQTGQQLHDYLSANVDDLGTYEFKIELVDDLGQFSKCNGTSLIKWKTNFLRVLVVDIRILSPEIPRLSIGGRAFDTMHGLRLIDIDGNDCVIHIQVFKSISRYLHNRIHRTIVICRSESYYTTPHRRRKKLLWGLDLSRGTELSCSLNILKQYPLL